MLRYFPVVPVWIETTLGLTHWHCMQTAQRQPLPHAVKTSKITVPEDIILVIFSEVHCQIVNVLPE